MSKVALDKLKARFGAANTQLPDEVQKVHARTRTIYVQVIQD